MSEFRVKGTGGAGKISVFPGGIMMDLREGTKHNQGMIPKQAISYVNNSAGLFTSTVEVHAGVVAYRWTLGKAAAKALVSELLS